jgi:hypothetical protein
MIVFATFGDRSKYGRAMKYIEQEAINMQICDKILVYDETMLNKDFWEKHKDFISKNNRGFGYWIWKPQIVKQSFEIMNDNDILIYADSGCRLNKTGINRLKEYVQYATESKYGNVSFELSYEDKAHIEKKWTKGDLLYKYPIDINSPQLVGGIFIIRKCGFTIKLVDEWLSLVENYSLVDDSKSIIPNDSSFIEHRHDQSCWSVLRKYRGSHIITRDETYYDNFNNHMDKPIHAIRRR